jgi:hypothetical protein
MKRSAINRRTPFLKMHALGNHFILVDARKRPFSPDLATITEMCRHHSGIGAEQLLVLTRSPTADAALDIYNVDGFKAEACGNATRCVAWYLMDQTNQKTTSISCNGRSAIDSSRSPFSRRRQCHPSPSPPHRRPSHLDLRAIGWIYSSLWHRRRR